MKLTKSSVLIMIHQFTFDRKISPVRFLTEFVRPSDGEFRILGVQQVRVSGRLHFQPPFHQKNYAARDDPVHLRASATAAAAVSTTLHVRYSS